MGITRKVEHRKWYGRTISRLLLRSGNACSAIPNQSKSTSAGGGDGGQGRSSEADNVILPRRIETRTRRYIKDLDRSSHGLKRPSPASLS